MPHVSFHNISKNFADTQALSQWSFVCKEGEIHTLLGENGAGKSTLAGLLAGFYLPSSGEIRIADKVVRLHSPQKSLQCGIGVVFQHPLLVPELSVMENLLLGNAWWKRFKGCLSRYEELSTLLGIHINPNQCIRHLSLGQQQYIEIIRALWHGQKILVFDETTALLSHEEAERLGVIIRKLAENKHTILYITHKLHEAIALSDHMTLVRQGKKVAEIPHAAITKGKSERTEKQLEHEICRFIFGEEENTYGEPVANIPSTCHPQRQLPREKSPYDKEKIKGKTKESAPLLEVCGISGQEEEQACSVHNISFSINSNEILGIAGIDGHGQKHFAEILAGQRLPKSGTICLHGQEITTLSNAQRQKLGIHYASEDRLFEGLVGSENIALNLQIKNIGLQPFWKHGIAKWKYMQEYAKKIMQVFFIPLEYHASAATTLSGGTMQKVILARELSQPNLCVGILHQPTHGLDVRTAKEFHEKLRMQLNQNCSFIIISSDMDELLSLSTRLAVLKNGKLSPCFENNAEARHILTTLMASQ